MKKTIRSKQVLLTGISIASASWVAYKMWIFPEWHSFTSSVNHDISSLPVVLILVFLLMLINVGLETRKWQLLAAPIDFIPFLKALKQVIKGIQMGLITPSRTGDPVGKAVCFDPKKRTGIILLSLTGSAIQNAVILVFTVLAIVLAGQTGYKYLDSISGYYSSINSSFVIFTVLFLISLIVLFRKILVRTKLYVKITKQFEVFRNFSLPNILHIVTLTLVRYLIFTLQFIILLRFFGLPPAASGFIPVFLFYGAITFVPSLGAGDLGIRSTIALFILGETAVSGPGILLATTLVWFFNIALPALIPVLIQPFRYSIVYLKSRYYRTLT